MILQMQRLNKVIPIFLILILITNFYVNIVHADVIVLPTLAVALIIGALFVAVGIMFATEEARQQAITYAWQSAGQVIRDFITSYAETWVEGNSMKMDMDGEMWNAIVEWLTNLFADSSGNLLPAVGGIDDWIFYYTNEQVTSAMLTSVPYLHSIAKQNGTTLVPYDLFVLAYSINGSQRTKTDYYFMNNTVLHMDSAIRQTYVGTEINCTVPIVTDFSGRSAVYFGKTMQSSPGQYYRSLDENFKMTIPHLSVSESTLIRNSSNGRIYVRDINNTTIYLSEQAYNNVNEFLFDYVTGGVSLPLNGDVPAWENAKSVPGDTSVSVTVPGTMADLTDVEVGTNVEYGELVDVGSGTGVITIPDTTTGNDTTDKFKFSIPELVTEKFPFCIPFDLFRAFYMILQPAETPRFEIPFVVDSLGWSETIVVDFADFSTLAAIIRWFLSAIFLIMLILATRKLIRG